MKKILFILLLFANFCQAQNYQCLQTGVKPFYTNGDGYLRGMRIDSVIANGTDTIFYPYHTPRGNYAFAALDSTGGSWLGKKVIKQADGTFLFDDLAGDTVVIKTQANIGDTWTFYRDTTNTSYKATITGVDTMTILGVVDSIKKITIEADINGVINSQDPVNNFEIILSKNHGFVQVFDLYTFPYRLTTSGLIFGVSSYDYYLDLLLGDVVTLGDGIASNYNLVTTVNSIFHLVPFHNPTYGEIYNFSVGQVLESKEIKTYPYSSSGEHITTITIDTILSKNTSGFITNYTVAASSFSQDIAFVNGGPPDTNSSYSSGGTTFSFNDTTLLIDTTHMPEEWNAQYFYHFFPKANYDSVSPCPDTVCIIDQNNILYPSGAIEFEALLPSVNAPGPDPETIGVTNWTYGVGYGQFGNNTIDYVDGYVQSGAIIYADINNVSCGTYFPLSVKQVYEPLGHIEVFPNPASNLLNINAANTIKQISIYNMIGQAVFVDQYNSQQVQINIANLPAGIYFVKINGIEVRKIIKR